MAKIGFIGLGNMGLPMAGNLAKKGHEVKAFDLVEDNLTKAAQAGVKKVASAADAAKDAEFVVTMVPAGKDTLAIYEKAGVLQAAEPGTLFIDSSTIDVASARKAHELAKAARHVVGRCAGLWRHGRRAGRHAHLHGRRHQGGLRQGQGGARGHGPQDRALRRCRAPVRPPRSATT